jgi:hypothetical protein
VASTTRTVFIIGSHPQPRATLRIAPIATSRRGKPFLVRDG